MNPLLLLRVHRGTAALLAVLTLSAALLIAALPRVAEASYDDALHSILTGTSAGLTDLTVSRRTQGPQNQITAEGGFQKLDREWRESLPPSLASLMDTRPGNTSHYSAKTVGTPVADRVGPGHLPLQLVDVAWLSGADQRIRYVDGVPPGPPTVVPRVPGHPDLRDVDLFEIALVRSAAELMRIPAGTILVLGNSRPMLAKVTGIFEPVNAADRYWHHDLNVIKASVRRMAGTDREEHHITALTGPSSLTRLNGDSRDLRYYWVLAVDNAKIDARNAGDTVAGVAEFRRRVGLAATDQITTWSQVAGFSVWELGTALDEVLNDYLRQLATAQALAYLATGGLAVVAAGVLALAAQLLTERMAGALALARARGASLRQVVLTGTGTVALACAPAALIGYALSYLVPGPVTSIVHLGPLFIVAVALVFAATRVALAHRRPLNERRADVAARRPSPRRLMLELVVVVLALAGAYLLRNRGLTTDVRGGSAPAGDPFLMLVPVALTVAVALIVLRCYPYPLRLVVWLAARARPAVPFVGMTLAARARAVTALPVLILLPALAVSVYGAVVGGTLDATQRLAAWQATGAAGRVESAAELPAGVVAAVREVPGVRTVLPADKGTAQIGLGGRSATVVAIDLDAYRRLVAGTPLTVPAAPAGGPAGTIPALVSPDLANLSEFEIGWHVRMKLSKRGVVADGLPGIGFTTHSLIIVPFDASERAGSREYTSMLLLGGEDIDAGRLRAATGNVPPIHVATFGESLGRITGTPLTGTITTAFQVVTVALAVYALLTVIIALVTGAADRVRALSFLRTLGLSERQAAALTVLEVTPLIFLTACAGLALGLALPAALGPGLDLGVYAGGIAVRAYEIDPGTPVLLAAGLTAVAVGGAFLHAAIGRRRSLGSILRVGD
ncbi:FtsX-like permease family protein [Sphaerisporangium rubeum]|uniref:Putative ABC transport system permease protein n=1 Tax=Sphaerisporangium rubeum TaxID=321317 RepID=A0A7X0IH53_9ACTN|nr:FtsX-like permease family protein [Sphaerisporangium rubeum]MBB6475081.1 putative ABC transport system permease protein [Sphaerisporangium rubeum]